MSTTTAERAAAPKKKKQKPDPVWRCQFCAMGHHRSCPRATRHNGKLWLCRCAEGEGEHHGLYCLECKHDRPDEVSEQTWACLDRYACEARRQARNERNPLWRMVHRSKVHGDLVRKAKRLEMENMLAGIDVTQDAAIDRLHSILDGIAATKKTTRVRKPSPPKPTTGKCECCGEPTKGGRFLPGHDARLASRLVQQALGGDAAALEELRTRNWTKKIPAAQRVRLGVEA